MIMDMKNELLFRGCDEGEWMNECKTITNHKEAEESFDYLDRFNYFNNNCGSHSPVFISQVSSGSSSSQESLSDEIKEEFFQENEPITVANMKYVGEKIIKQHNLKINCEVKLLTETILFSDKNTLKKLYHKASDCFNSWIFIALNVYVDFKNEDDEESEIGHLILLELHKKEKYWALMDPNYDLELRSKIKDVIEKNVLHDMIQNEKLKYKDIECHKQEVGCSNCAVIGLLNLESRLKNEKLLTGMSLKTIHEHRLRFSDHLKRKQTLLTNDNQQCFRINSLVLSNGPTSISSNESAVNFMDIKQPKEGLQKKRKRKLTQSSAGNYNDYEPKTKIL